MFTHDVYAMYITFWVPTLRIGEVGFFMAIWQIILWLLLFVLHYCFRVTAARTMWSVYTELSIQQAVPLRAELKAVRCRVNNPPVVVAYQCWQNMEGMLRLSHYIDIYSMPASIHIYYVCSSSICRHNTIFRGVIILPVNDDDGRWFLITQQ